MLVKKTLVNRITLENCLEAIDIDYNTFEKSFFLYDCENLFLTGVKTNGLDFNLILTPLILIRVSEVLKLKKLFLHQNGYQVDKQSIVFIPPKLHNIYSIIMRACT